MANSDPIETSSSLVVTEEAAPTTDSLPLYLTGLFNENVVNRLTELNVAIDDRPNSASEVWQRVENQIGRLQLQIGSFFADPSIALDETGVEGPPQALPTTPRPAGVHGVRYVAANFRGLYQTNGRQTMIGLSGRLWEKASDVAAHKALHELYMRHVVRKAESLNQLFLANSSLCSLSVCFVDDEVSSIHRTGATATLSIGKDLSQLWSDQREIWAGIVSKVLDKHDDPAVIRDAAHRMSESRRTILDRVSKRALGLLSTVFFKDWLTLPHTKQFTSPITAIEEFQLWLLSVCWLSFYCNPDHAGQYFYTVRMPGILRAGGGATQQIDGTPSDLPASSISVVSETPLPEDVLRCWNGLPASLDRAPQFETLVGIIRETYGKFEKQRRDPGAPPALEAVSAFVSPSAEAHRRVPCICFRRVRVLLDMARRLINRAHEGRPLRFCFIYGFSWERIDSESRGSLSEVVGDLRKQWLRFEKKTLRKDAGRQLRAEEVADAMAKWIKTTDLPLQPWDTALFMEEAPDAMWPLPTSIVRITDSYSSGGDHIATEFQLRKALKAITGASPTTVAVLADKSGLILCVHGKCILLGYEGESLKRVGMWRDDTDEDVFKTFLMRQLSLDSFRTLSAKQRRDARDVVNDLCEALVTLGYGGLIVLWAPIGGNQTLPPLNPTWRVRPGENGPELKEGILTYAMLAALDGATEISFPDGDGSMALSVRRCVLPKIEIWTVDEDGDVVLRPDFDNEENRLGLIGKGTRHHSALAISAELKGRALVLTVSADGPVTMWRDGRKVVPEVPTPGGTRPYQPRFKP